jgi:phosphate-selective porin OprO and OprP
MKFIAVFVVLFHVAHSLARPEENNHSPLGNSIGYFDEGINFKSEAAQFQSRFRFRMQNRFTYETEDTEDLSARQADFSVRRFRLRMDGNVLDKRLMYKIQLSFTRGDMDWDRTQYPNIMRDAAVGWKLTDATTLWYGQTKLPGNRQRVISSGAQQFVDRSLLNATFNIDRDLGFQVYHRMFDERPLWLKFAVSNGDGRATENRDNGLAYTFRTEWLPLGTFKKEGDYFEADLARELTPKLSLGAVYSVNKNASRPGGQLGTQFPTGVARDLETWFVDKIFKYRGFSWQSEYARRWTDQPLVGASAVVYKGEAINTQMGYLFENNLELGARYTQLWADRATQARENERKQYTAVVSRYFNGHVMKLQSDITYDESFNPIGARTDRYSWIYRLQLEVGI